MKTIHSPNRRTIEAIDVHAHIGVCRRSAPDILNKFMSGDAVEVVRRARLADTCLTIVSPLEALMPRRHGDSETANTAAARVILHMDGLLQWAVLDPTKPKTFEQVTELLSQPQCVGIKIHPEEHGYRIADAGREIFEFAARNAAIVMTHSGEQKSLPEDFLPFADEFPTVRLVLAHLGCGFDDDPTHQIRAIQACRHRNIYTDTSSAMSMTPNLLEWAVREIGADLILYGTDSPLYFTPMQRARIDCADITEDAKKRILRDNAVALFGLGSA